MHRRESILSWSKMSEKLELERSGLNMLGTGIPPTVSILFQVNVMEIMVIRGNYSLLLFG